MGTLLNVISVLVGGSIGLIFGARFPERVRQTVMAGLGLFVVAYGLQMFLKTENSMIVLGSLLLGGISGEALRIEDRLHNLGVFLQRRFLRQPSTAQASEPTTQAASLSDRSGESGENRFARAFLVASLVFCVGPMTILGSIQDGLAHDYRLLAIKSILDGFASLAFASTMGVGVLFSVLVILVYQGGLTLLAAQAQALISAQMMAEMTATGGVMMVGIALSSLLEIVPIRVANFLPALVIAPVLVAIVDKV